MAGVDRCDTYANCFECVRSVLGGAVPAEVEPGLAAPRASTEAIEHGSVVREVLGERFVHYLLPAACADQDLPRCLHVPSSSEPLSARTALWPQARLARCAARATHQRASCQRLVSRPVAARLTVGRHRRSLATVGPGARRCRVSHRLEQAGLRAAAQALQHEDTHPGRWLVAQTISSFGALESRGFPVVLSFMRHGRAAPSALAPARLREHLTRPFEEGT